MHQGRETELLRQKNELQQRAETIQTLQESVEKTKQEFFAFQTEKTKEAAETPRKVECSLRNLNRTAFPRMKEERKTRERRKISKKLWR